MGSLFGGKMELYWEVVSARNYLFDDRLAMMEMRGTLARLLWEFEVHLKDEGQDVPIYDHKSLSAGKLEVRLKRVER
jgi:hypothetical protein